MRKKWIRGAIATVAGLLVLVLGLAGFASYYQFAWAGETEPVTFRSGELSLAGLLVKPGGKGPHPAVVILHGSGRADGTHGLPDYRIHVNAFVRKGLAVLVYDKRGTGDSQGDFSTAVYEDFVRDAVAAVQFLRTRNEIDPHRIGLLGMSEGGWLAPEVATIAGDMAFIINKCGSPLPWDQTVLFEIENDLKAAGLDPKLIPEVLELRTRTWKYYVDAAADAALAAGAQRDAINAGRAAIGKRVDASKFSGLAAPLDEYDAQLYARLAAKVSYDPTGFLRQLDLPMLWVFGADDINVPTTRSVAVLEQLRSDLKRDITVRVYPGVGHSLMTWKGIRSGGYVEGYLELIGDWAQKHAARR